MAKFHGVIGYVRTEETSPGVYEEVVTERKCRGDILRNTQRIENVQQANDNLLINNNFSIVTDEFVNQNIPFMRYLKWNGIKWKITNLEFRRPRVLLTIGGIYNGD